MNKNRKLIIPVIAAEALALTVALAIIVVTVFNNFINPLLEEGTERDPVENEISDSVSSATEKENEEQEQTGSSVSSSEETDEPELGIPDCFTIESDNWGEIYYNEIISKIDNYVYFKVFDTEKIESLCIKDENRYWGDAFIPGEIIYAYLYINELHENENYQEKNYYDMEELVSSENLTEKDKAVLQGFFAEGDFVEKYETAVLETVLNYFYGKNTFDVNALSDENYFYVTEDGKGFYAKVGGIGGAVPLICYRLADIKYEGNEAVIYLNIIKDDYTGYLTDYSNGNILAYSNKTDVYGFENEVAFETLCKENNISYDDMGTAKLRIGKNENGVYIIGWEGTVPGSIKW